MFAGPFPDVEQSRAPQTLNEAIALLAYGDRGIVDRPAVIAFIGDQIAASVIAERKTCAQIVAEGKTVGWCEDFGDLREDLAGQILARGTS